MSEATPIILPEDFNQAAVYPGSFSPLTWGHIEVIKSATKLPYPKLYVAIGVNPDKKNTLFTLEETLAMVEEAMDKYVRPHLRPGQEVIVRSYEGLTVNFMQQVGASLCVRGIRNHTDFEFERNLAQLNAEIYQGAFPDDNQIGFTQVYFSADPSLVHVSSSAARDLCKYRQDKILLNYVPPEIAAKMIEKRDNDPALIKV